MQTQGDITFRYLSYLKAKHGNLNGLADANKVTVCDINENMLGVGKERSKVIGYSDKINWKVGNAERLVDEPDNTYDVYTIAFGIRNCTNIENVVREAYRVLKPGGRFMCMEFSKTNNPVFKQ
jgi:2-methoxy-6-polyprenyl-1,4-benzoquinol methylase